MGLLKDLYRKAIITLAIGLKNAESDLLKQKQTNSDSYSVEQKVGQNKLADALLNGVITQEVELLRDRNYMVSEAASKLIISDVDHVKGTYKVTNRNTLLINKPKVFEQKSYVSEIIMEVKNVTKNNIDLSNEIGKNNENLESQLNVEYIDVPKFKIERYVRKIVIKKNKKRKYRLDLYVPIFTDSLERMERIFDAELNRIKSGKTFTEHIEFDTIDFITQEAYGSDDLCKYKFKFVKFVDINVFNGSNVLTYDVDVEIWNDKITDKFIKPELREKYKNVEKKNVKLTADFRDLKV